MIFFSTDYNYYLLTNSGVKHFHPYKLKVTVLLYRLKLINSFSNLNDPCL